MEKCIFCQIVVGEIPCEKVYEDAEVFAFLDIVPVNAGHTLVIPKKHYENIFEVPDELFGHLGVVAKKVAHAIKDGVGADGVNVAMNNGKHAGQVVFHAHIHVMPRYEGDGYQLWKGREYKEHERGEVGEKIRKQIR